MHTLYSMQESGNCYKLRLAMAQLEVPFRITDIDIHKGESRTAPFLEINPNGKVPTLVLEDGRTITESNAGLFYLAAGSALLPNDRYGQAEALQWMFFEQYSHEPYIAVARFWLHLVDGREEKKDLIPMWLERGHLALKVMDQHLAAKDFFAGAHYSVADIALYAYTHMAGDGGFDRAGYRHVNAWLDRIANQSGHVTIDWRP